MPIVSYSILVVGDVGLPVPCGVEVAVLGYRVAGKRNRARASSIRLSGNFGGIFRYSAGFCLTAFHPPAKPLAPELVWNLAEDR